MLAGSGTAYADGSPELSYQWRIANASHSDLVSMTRFLDDAGQAPARFTASRRRDVEDRSALDDGSWTDFELTVTDGDGDSASDTMRLTIRGTTWTAEPQPLTVPADGWGLRAEPDGPDLRLTWNAAEGANGYRVRWGRSGTTPVVAAAAASPFAARNLTAGATDWSSSVEQAAPSPPEQPASVSPTANTGPDLTGAAGESVTLQGITSINPYGEWWSCDTSGRSSPALASR